MSVNQTFNSIKNESID